MCVYLCMYVCMYLCMHSAPLLSVPLSTETIFKVQIFDKEVYCVIHEYFKVFKF